MVSLPELTCPPSFLDAMVAHHVLSYHPDLPNKSCLLPVHQVLPTLTWSDVTNIIYISTSTASLLPTTLVISGVIEFFSFGFAFSLRFACTTHVTHTAAAVR